MVDLITSNITGVAAATVAIFLMFRAAAGVAGCLLRIVAAGFAVYAILNFVVFR